MLWPHREETRELPGERDKARNNARKARKTTHALDGQHQDVDRTLRGSQSVRMTEDRDKWRKYIHGVCVCVWSTLGSRTAKVQNRTCRYSLGPPGGPRAPLCMRHTMPVGGVA